MFGSITSIANNNGLHIILHSWFHLFVQFYSIDCEWFVQDKCTVNYSIWSFGNLTTDSVTSATKEIKTLFKVSFERIRLYINKIFYLAEMAITLREVTGGRVVRAGISVTWMYCHDLEVVSLNPSWVELGGCSTSVLSRTWTEHAILFLPPSYCPDWWVFWTFFMFLSL